MTEFCDLATKHNTDKGPSGWNYTPAYQRWLEPRRNETKTVLELGVWRGASLRMWCDFFPDALVYGLDNDPRCIVTEGRIKTYGIDAYNGDILIPVLREIGPIDFFVDDAIHYAHQQTSVFGWLWPYLAPGGVYAIEEVRSDEIDKITAAIKGAENVARFELCPAHSGYNLMLIEKVAP